MNFIFDKINTICGELQKYTTHTSAEKPISRTLPVNTRSDTHAKTYRINRFRGVLLKKAPASAVLTSIFGSNSR